MKTSHPKLVLLLGTLALAACRSDPLGSTGVQVDLLTTSSRLYATSFSLLWLDDKDPLFQVRVPLQGTIDAVQAPAVSVFIAMSPAKVGTRRVVVRGFRDDQPVSEGSARFFTGVGVWTEIGVPMVPYGSVPDTDGDGLPDSVDNCPRQRDPCGSASPVVEPSRDAAPPDDAGGAPDASAVDGAPDAGAVDPRPPSFTVPSSSSDARADKPRGG